MDYIDGEAILDIILRNEMAHDDDSKENLKNAYKALDDIRNIVFKAQGKL